MFAASNMIRRTDWRRSWGPLKMVTRAARGCWSMPAPTKRPWIGYVIGRCFVGAPSSYFLFRLCTFVCVIMYFFIFIELPFVCLRFSPRKFPLFYCSILPFFVQDVDAMWAASIPIYRTDARRWFWPLCMVTLTVRGCWSLLTCTILACNHHEIAFLMSMGSVFYIFASLLMFTHRGIDHHGCCFEIVFITHRMFAAHC